MFSFSAASLFLLANVGGAASASIERKRFTVNTDAKQPSEAFGLSEPFGVDRNLLVGSMSMSTSMRSMCMSMSMRMDMSMSMSMDMDDVLVVSKLNSFINEAEIIDDATSTQVVSEEGSRFCPSVSEEDMSEVEVHLSYDLETSSIAIVYEMITKVDNAILNSAADSLMSCEETRRKLRDANFSLKKIEIESEVSEDEKCAPSGDGVCSVVISTLTVSTDSDVPAEIVGAKTLTVVEDSLVNSSIEGAQLEYQPMKSQSTSQAEPIEETPKEEVSVRGVEPAEDDVTKSSEGISGAAAGAVAAGVLAVVFGGVVLLMKKRRASSSTEEYFGEDVPITPDLA